MKQEQVKKLQKFYALYKQATLGPCSIDKPSKWGCIVTAINSFLLKVNCRYLNTFNYLRDSKKWCVFFPLSYFQLLFSKKREAWNGLGTMSKDEAMRTYVTSLSSDCPGWEEWKGTCFRREGQLVSNTFYLI